MSSYIFKDAKVAFAQVTGEGRKGLSGENEYTIALELDPKEKKKFLKFVADEWEENKPKGAKDPKYDPESWFVSKDDKPEAIWLSEKVESGIAYEAGEETDYTMKHFDKLGSGSVCDVGVNIYVWDNKFGKGISCALTVIQLKEFKKYSGKGSESLGGKSLNADEVQASGTSEKKEKKEKKKKKKSKE